MLGLSVTGRVGSTWQFAPQFGNLTFAEGGFTTALGKFSAAWSRPSGNGYTARVSAPTGTMGQFVLPVVEQGVIPTVVVNGAHVDKGDVTWARKTGVVFDTVLVSNLNGGNFTIVVT